MSKDIDANFTPEQETTKEYKYKLRPFNLFCAQNFPLIEENFDALTTYQLLCKLNGYLNKIINNQNTVQDNVNIQNNNISALYNAYNQLQDYVNHYFDNLDVQEEINNKLDEMVQDGSLLDIIQPFLEEYFNTLNTKIDNQNNTISNLQTNVNTLNSRVNEITNLPDGSTSGDAELQDIRIGAFGRTYSTAGDAVRSILKNFFNDITKKVKETKVENKYLTFRNSSADSKFYCYYTLKTKKGKLYLISTLASEAAPLISYYFNNELKTVPFQQSTGNYNYDVVVEGTGNDIYINMLTSFQNFYVGEILSNNFEDLYFEELNDVDMLEKNYIDFNGRVNNQNYYNLYSFTPEKGKIYLINSYSNSFAPLIFQENGQIIPKEPIEGTKYNGQYIYIPNQNNLNKVYVNNSFNDGLPTILVSKFTLTFPENKVLNNNNVIGITKNLICIGDSLTAGETYISNTSPKFYNNYYSFPYFLSKLLHCDNFKNFGRGGSTAQSYWNDIISDLEIPNNTLFTVWLGTNNEFTDTIDTDCADANYLNWSDTQTGCMGKILAKILTGENNKIILLNNDSGSSIETNNLVISKFAEKFDCLLVDVYNSNSKDTKYHTAYNNYVNNVHFNTAGNNYIANLIVNTLSNKINENPNFINFKEIATDLPYQPSS